MIGTVLFLGKPENKGFALFGGIIAFVMIILAILDIYIIAQGINDGNVLIFMAGSIGLLSSVIVFFSVTIAAKTDDMFFSIIGFFALLSSLNTIMLTFSLYFAKETAFGYTSIFTSVFFLFYTVSGYSKRISDKEQKLEKDRDEVSDSKKRKWFFQKSQEDMGADKEIAPEAFLLFVNDRGMVSILLGFALGFHAMTTQILIGRIGLFSTVTDQSEISQLSHSIGIICQGFVLVVLLVVFLTVPQFREYASPDIPRLVLWDYDEMKETLHKVKTGEISKKRLVASMSGKLIKAGLGSLKRKITGDDD